MFDFGSRREFSRSQERTIKLVTLAVVLTVWEVLAMNANPLLMARPSAVLVEAWHMTASGELMRAFADSASSFAIGFAISLVLGVVIGVLMGANRLIEKILDPYINALYAMPIVALIPLLMLWVGIGFQAKVLIVVLFAIFPIIINTTVGVKNVDRHYLDIGIAFNATRSAIFWKIVAPYALPFVASGIRLAVGRGIIAMVVAEFLTAISGLGGLIINYTNSYQTARAFVPVLLLAFLGIFLTWVVQVAEEKLGAWRRP